MLLTTPLLKDADLELPSDREEENPRFWAFSRERVMRLSIQRLAARQASLESSYVDGMTAGGPLAFEVVYRVKRGALGQVELERKPGFYIRSNGAEDNRDLPNN